MCFFSFLEEWVGVRAPAQVKSVKDDKVCFLSPFVTVIRQKVFSTVNAELSLCFQIKMEERVCSASPFCAGLSRVLFVAKDF